MNRTLKLNESLFWSKVKIGGLDECWPWMASTWKGYGHLVSRGMHLKAHRVAYLACRGSFRSTKIVFQTCLNRRCCNPCHLELRDHEKQIMKYEEHFWSHVHICRPDQCWPWVGCLRKCSNGSYGVIRMPWTPTQGRGKMVGAHRMAYQLHNKCTLPPEIEVLHKCDNPPCCNPNHLFTGTQGENVRDCIQKGRKKCLAGQSNPNSKLTQKIVDECRKLYVPHSRTFGANALGKKHGVAGNTMYAAIFRSSYK